MRIQKIRYQKFIEQKGKCFYCQSPMCAHDISTFAKQHGLTSRRARLFFVTAEHLTAKSCGGRDTHQNIVAVCLYCNRTRHFAKRPLDPHRYAVKVQAALGRGKWHGWQQAAQRQHSTSHHDQPVRPVDLHEIECRISI
ncbi:HNH endonuclease [Sphingopyxis yananensis]|uniref:HNH endonuclease n=1 Tax=Sphingopyxis yananensis TaxID=2886687 RepID=UPI001D111E89|nr:HNH endonuclease [Sphingopyxis yananensis]MCC2602402.1 HNH endonuclease [Sphingopyxis yananensis]